MQNEQALEKFMRAPWLYLNLTLPRKLPPPSAPIQVTNLPILGYLEQSVATSLTQALGALSKVKPKYPYKSLKASAAEYVGLYLKGKSSFSNLFIKKNNENVYST